MSQQKPFRWAFVGAGIMAKTAAEAIKKSGRHDIVSVYTRTYKNAQNFAAKYGATAYQTLEEAVARDCNNAQLPLPAGKGCS